MEPWDGSPFGVGEMLDGFDWIPPSKIGLRGSVAIVAMEEVGWGHSLDWTTGQAAGKVQIQGISEAVAWNKEDFVWREHVWLIFNGVHSTAFDNHIWTCICDSQTSMRVWDLRASSPARYFEMYCGGIGGWSYASKWCQNQGLPITCVCANDWDSSACKYFALNHGGIVSTDAPSKCRENQLPWVLQAPSDIALMCKLTAVTGANAIAGSPPCPAWSGASRGPGLTATSGKELLKTIAFMRITQPKWVAIENVCVV